MNVLVTGSAGFLGRRLVRALRARGDRVLGVARPGSATTYRHADLVDASDEVARVDLGAQGAEEHLGRLIARHEVEAVVHLAAETQVSIARAEPEPALAVNVRGTWAVLEACRLHGIRRVVCASSDKVYGDGPAPYREDQALLAHGVYATSKACADLIAHAYLREYGTHVGIARCANLYGPGHVNWSTLIPGTIRRALGGERPVVRSDGSPRRDYLHVDDAVDGYLRLLDSDCVGAVNFGSGHPASALEVVRLVLAVTERPDLEPVVLGGAEEEIRDQWLDASLAREALGWRPKRTLTEGLLETVPWYKEHLRGRAEEAYRAQELQGTL